MWFDSWSDVLRVVLVGLAAYLSLVLLIRASGKRSLAQMNAFDLVVTVALGSTLATILLSSDVAYAEGVTAIVLLLALQVIVAVLVKWSPRFRRVVTAAPALLVVHGSLDERELRRNRVTRKDVEQAVRQSGQGAMKDVAAVILESDGKMSVIPEASLGDGSAVRDIPGWPS
ncbi:DUF421 domain-containing protein [Microbacterium imperiale]|uniref:DUF421 domain-containing protein n=1 Tax=Microbacterium imperiale TaxID=33884 RepID=A0A9W6HGV0_9MICO|nr:YetF domain-containing protein [Microbacterium imperiale]MBP2421051.1 uncharacterized membrane protein YcaP (DUF421 family) [Microbacterium imperiale]MDS0199834.1 DUF421 domain-containing protein [Microbacterium imperiale]GLJ80344.1 DUF421 domain-containing protein [Microbacterium imperiale]